MAPEDIECCPEYFRKNLKDIGLPCVRLIRKKISFLIIQIKLNQRVFHIMHAFDKLPNAQGLIGYYYNEVGSKMFINKVQGSQFWGVFQTAVGPSNFQEKILFSGTLVNCKDDIILGWMINWSPHESITVFSGSWQKKNQNIVAHYYLNRSTNKNQLQNTSNSGQNTFVKLKAQVQMVKYLEYNEICRKILLQIEPNLLPEELYSQINQGQQIVQIKDIYLKLPNGEDHQLDLLQFEILPSTMILSENWPRQLVTKNRSFAFTAKTQSKGRGQNSNQWASPMGNMYLTLLVLKQIELIAYLPMLMANTISKTLKSYFADPIQAEQKVKCKWINDIFIGNGKVSGILITCSNSDHKFYSQIGIGINLKKSPLQNSTALELEIKKQINVRDFTIGFASQAIENIYLLNSQNTEEIAKQYKNNLLYLNQKVNIFKPDLKTLTHTGIFQDITQVGNAILNEKGQKIIVTTGRMRPIHETSQKNQ